MIKTLLLTTVIACGLGFAATAPSHAAGFGSGLNQATAGSSLIQDAQYYGRRHRCRQVRVCRGGPYGRRCHWERICRW